MYEQFIRRYGGNPSIKVCLDAYVERAYITAIESAFEALRSPQGAGFELVLIAMLCMQKAGKGFTVQARDLGQEALTSPEYPMWDKELVKVVLGTTDLDRILERLPQEAPNVVASSLGLVGDRECKRCQAYYYHGARLMLLDSTKDGRGFLREAILIGAASMVEFELAIAQLEENAEEDLDMAYVCLGHGYLDLLLRNDLGQAREAEKAFARIGATRELRVVQGLIARRN